MKLELVTSEPLKTGDWVAVGDDAKLRRADPTKEFTPIATATENIPEGAEVILELGRVRAMPRPTVWKEMTDVGLGIKFSVGTGTGQARRVYWTKILSRKELEQAVAPAAVLETYLDEWEKVVGDLRGHGRLL